MFRELKCNLWGWEFPGWVSSDSYLYTCMCMYMYHPCMCVCVGLLSTKILFLTLSNLFSTGHSSYIWDYPEVPAGACPARPDLPSPPVLWYLAGEQPAEQVRSFGALPARPSSGEEATRGEVAEGGQARVLGGAGRVGEAGWPNSGTLCLPQGWSAWKGALILYDLDYSM